MKTLFLGIIVLFASLAGGYYGTLIWIEKISAETTVEEDLEALSSNSLEDTQVYQEQTPQAQVAEPIAQPAPQAQVAEPITQPAPQAQVAEPIAQPAPQAQVAEPIAQPAPQAQQVQSNKKESNIESLGNTLGRLLGSSNENTSTADVQKKSEAKDNKDNLHNTLNRLL